MELSSLEHSGGFSFQCFDTVDSALTLLEGWEKGHPAQKIPDSEILGCCHGSYCQLV